VNRLLWVLQIVVGAYFILIGAMHFVVPPGLPEPMAWMYELPQGIHYVSGAAEILGGLGLILPGLLRTRVGLTPLAALGLVLVMAAASAWQVTRGGYVSMVPSLALGGIAAFIAYARWRLRPLSPRSA